MKKTVVSILFFVSAYALAQEQQLSPAGYLNKLSISLRGISPSPQEYEDLSMAVQNGRAATFVRHQKTSYLASSLYVEKMRTRLNDLFWLKPFNNSPLISESARSLRDNETQNATDDLFVRIVSENGSWDRLLTEKKYNSFSSGDPNNSSSEEEINFFSALNSKYSKRPTIQSSQPRDFVEKTKIEFSPNDSRVAGVITSPRFFARYGTTGVNKNRRRAAAVFRIFMCDAMTAAVPDPSQKMKQIYDLQFPEGVTQPNSGTMTEEEIRVASRLNDDIHGTQKDCMACHYKLDPMGQTLRGSQFVPSLIPWPGRLTFKKSDGKLVDVPAAGIGELAAKITEQPEYLECQTGHFWNWFIGRDVPLTSQTHEELVKKFEEVGRRTGDFISYLVDRPEFKVRASINPEKLAARKVSDIFKRCQSCHQNKTDDVTGGPLLNLTQWPPAKNSSLEDKQQWLERVSKKIGLKDGGQTRSMPPAEADWSLSRQDLLLIKKWIEIGAPDQKGQKQVGE